MRSAWNRIELVLILALTIFSLYVIWPSEPWHYLPIHWPSGAGLHVGSFKRDAFRLGLDLQGGTLLVLQADTAGLTPDQISKLPETLQETVKIIDRRINNIGVSEPEIQLQGGNRISVALPGISPDAARNLVGRTAELEFKGPVYDPATGKQQVDAEGKPVWQPLFVKGADGQTHQLTGRYLQPNSYVTTQNGLPAVAFSMTSEGANYMGDATSQLIGKPMAIYLDNDFISAPIVQSQITDSGVITGVTEQEAETLVAQLNAGALPVPLTVIQQTNVDATLGRDSVKNSVHAGEVGILLVMLFMILYYRLPGVLASFALAIYTCLVLAIFKLIPVTLTLAGIAAFVLSVGMAVDANILIFERMREELRAGRGLNAAIESGFSRAWPSIRDSNISTLMTSVILYWFGDQFGADLVKGFALTLFIGVLVSLFSAIFVTRTFLRLLVGTGVSRHLEWFGTPSPRTAEEARRAAAAPPRALPGWLNLVGNRNWYFALSALIMVPGLISLAIPPALRPGVEFTAGTTFTVRFQHPPSTEAIASELSSLGFRDSRVQGAGSDDFLIRTRPLAGNIDSSTVGPKQSSDLDNIVQGLESKFGPLIGSDGQVTHQPLNSATVSPLVSREIVKDATAAVLVATIAILLWISWAFRKVSHPLRYGVSAIVALLHDVIVVLGLFSIFGKLFGVEIDTIFITGLLTVIGFSVHDTIVVFDRVRENIQRTGARNFASTVNDSLLQTLGRSINTSGTVVLTLLALLLIGGPTIRNFVLVLLIGIISGTYSSIAIASQLLVVWENGTFSRLAERVGIHVRREAQPEGVQQPS
jgi:protein-export membrane protein SecD/preprotein translocase SecF subunit